MDPLDAIHQDPLAREGDAGTVKLRLMSTSALQRCGLRSGQRRRLIGALAASPWSGRVRAADAGWEQCFRVVRRGTGRDAIFLPGLGTSGDVWSGSTSALGAKVRAHVVHFAGFAGEPVRRDAKDGFMRSRAVAVGDYIARQGLQQPLLIAHSGAAAMALMLALDRPHSVGGVMVVDGLPFPAELELGAAATPQVARQKADETFEAHRRLPRVQYAAYRDEEARNACLASEDARRVAEWAIRSDRRVLMQADRELNAIDLRERLGALTTPLTVVHADQASLGAPAGWMKRIYMEQYGRVVPTPTRVEIADARHFLMLDRPQAFAAALHRFVGA